MKKPLLLLLQFLLALVQLNLVTVKGFLSPLRTNLTLQKVSIEVPALRSVISTEPWWESQLKLLRRHLRHASFQQFAGSDHSGCTPGSLQQCCRAALLKMRTFDQSLFALMPRCTVQFISCTGSSWLALHQAVQKAFCAPKK